jgi:hypothetical protein
MSKKIKALHLKENAIIAAYDELSMVQAAGRANTEILQSVLTALSNYPIINLTKTDNIIADYCVSSAIGLLQECIKLKTPEQATIITDQLLGIALGHVQAAIIKHRDCH